MFVLVGSEIAQAQSAQALITDAAKALGGRATLGALKSQIVESEGKQFNSSHKLNLDVATIVGIHGDSASQRAARAAVQSGQK